MTDFRLKIGKMLWGAAFANTATFQYPLDQFQSYSEPRAGSATVQTPSGIEDAWTVGTDYVLSGTLRWIPQATAGGITGWDGATGLRAMLEWLRDKNVGRFYPDASGATTIDVYLVDPMSGGPTPESDGTRNLPIKIRNASTAFDGY